MDFTPLGLSMRWSESQLSCYLRISFSLRRSLYVNALYVSVQQFTFMFSPLYSAENRSQLRHSLTIIHRQCIERVISTGTEHKETRWRKTFTVSAHHLTEDRALMMINHLFSPEIRHCARIFKLQLVCFSKFIELATRKISIINAN